MEKPTAGFPYSRGLGTGTVPHRRSEALASIESPRLTVTKWPGILPQGKQEHPHLHSRQIQMLRLVTQQSRAFSPCPKPYLSTIPSCIPQPILWFNSRTDSKAAGSAFQLRQPTR